MTIVSTPSWTDDVGVIAMTTLARNATARATLDLRTKWGAEVYVRIGRGGTNALTTGIKVSARRTINNGAILQVGSAAAAFVGQIAAAVATTCTAAGSPNPAGSTTLTVASTASMVAGDIIWVASAAPANTDSEWCLVARNVDATHLLLDAPTQFAHSDVTHTVRTKSDIFSMWLEGGATYEIVVDYGASTTGDTAEIEAWAQTFDNITVTP